MSTLRSVSVRRTGTSVAPAHAISCDLTPTPEAPPAAPKRAAASKTFASVTRSSPSASLPSTQSLTVPRRRTTTVLSACEVHQPDSRSSAAGRKTPFPLTGRTARSASAATPRQLACTSSAPINALNCSLFLVQSATRPSTIFSLSFSVHQTIQRSHLRRSLRNELNLTFGGASRCAIARQKSAGNIPEFLFLFYFIVGLLRNIRSAQTRQLRSWNNSFQMMNDQFMTVYINLCIYKPNKAYF